MSRKLSLERSTHGMRCIQAHDLTQQECQIIRGIVCNIHMDSEDYRLRQPAGPFLQGYEEPFHGRDGWVLVEFWSDDVAGIRAFVEHINRALGCESAEHKDLLITTEERAS